MKDKPLVSVVVPTFNSERFLEKCLASVKAQKYPNVEVIIVDNYSKDRTREIAEECGARIILCGAGRSRARNIGASYAKGEFVLFMDSDMELTHDVISQCVAKVAGGFDAVIIPEFSVGEGFWAKCRALEKQCYIGDDLIEGVRFFGRAVFEAVGGYDEDLEAGEDWDIHLRVKNLGFKIGRVNAFVKHHEGRLSLKDAIVKKHHYGKTMRRYRTKNPVRAKQQLRLIRPAFLKKWKELVKDPVHSLGMLFMKTCEFTAGLLGTL